VLLRYLSQVYKTLDQNLPDQIKTDDVQDVIAFFRAMLERVDTSLIDEWESMRHPELLLETPEARRLSQRELAIRELRDNPRALASRVRAEMHQLVAALARRDWEQATTCVRHEARSLSTLANEDDFSGALEPFFAEYDQLRFDHAARLAEHTQITSTGDGSWRVVQVLLDPEDDNLWHIEGAVDLSDGATLEGPLVAIIRIGT
jgi:hypothetical protein